MISNLIGMLLYEVSVILSSAHIIDSIILLPFQPIVQNIQFFQMFGYICFSITFW